MPTKEQKIKLWGERISSWEQSKESIRGFCFKRNIPLSTFKNWKDILRKKPSSPKSSFTELPLEERNSSSIIELTYKGITISLRENFSISTLQKIIKGLLC